MGGVPVARPRRRLRSRPPLISAQSMSAKGSLVPGSSHGGRRLKTLAISSALASALLEKIAPSRATNLIRA